MSSPQGVSRALLWSTVLQAVFSGWQCASPAVLIATINRVPCVLQVMRIAVELLQVLQYLAGLRPAVTHRDVSHQTECAINERGKKKTKGVVAARCHQCFLIWCRCVLGVTPWWRVCVCGGGGVCASCNTAPAAAAAALLTMRVRWMLQAGARQSRVVSAGGGTC